ncbi:Abi family protein [Weissella confusa]|nr:Abi family protein [Weissella confusa]
MRYYTCNEFNAQRCLITLDIRVGGFYVIWGFFMKRYRTIPQQLHILTNNHGLIIDDANEKAAKFDLMSYGYHEIINGYQDAFMQLNREHQLFDEGTRFEFLSGLFRFDVRLRLAIRLSTELFELTFKEALSDAIASSYGTQQKEYLNLRNYRQGNTNQYGETDRDWVMKQVKKILKRDKYKLVKHHKEAGNVPPWILIKRLTFGEAKQLFVLIADPKVKNKVVKTLLPDTFVEKYGMTAAKQFINDLVSLSHKYRNEASHANRMYDYYPAERNIGIKNFNIFDPTLYSEEYLDKGNYTRGIHALMTGLRYMRNPEPSAMLSQGIIDLLTGTFVDQTKERPQVNERLLLYVLRAMHIPYSVTKSDENETQLTIGSFSN